jgi:hypothetical protein
MKVLIAFFIWCILFAVAWPVALFALAAAPLVWLLSLPLRIVALAVSAVFALLAALFSIPARLLGHRSGAA